MNAQQKAISRNEMMVKVGSNIKEYIKTTDTTQKEVATRAGITECALSLIIDGKRIPRLDTAMNIADAMGISVTDLLYGVEK